MMKEVGIWYARHFTVLVAAPLPVAVHTVNLAPERSRGFHGGLPFLLAGHSTKALGHVNVTIHKYVSVDRSTKILKMFSCDAKLNLVDIEAGTRSLPCANTIRKSEEHNQNIELQVWQKC